jgi:hypothetical protein
MCARIEVSLMGAACRAAAEAGAEAEGDTAAGAGDAGAEAGGLCTGAAICGAQAWLAAVAAMAT